MAFSTRAREDFLLNVNELLDTLNSLITQMKSNRINSAIVAKATVLMKKAESAAVEKVGTAQIGRPVLDKGLVREYQRKVYPLANSLMTVLDTQFWKSFLEISKAYDILEN